MKRRKIVVVLILLVSLIGSNCGLETPRDNSQGESASSAEKLESDNPSSSDEDIKLDKEGSGSATYDIPPTVDETPEVTIEAEPTEEEKRAQELYESAISHINSSYPDRKKGYSILIEAAELKHPRSQELVAKAYLFGDDLPINLKKAAAHFKDLAANGNAVAQMVRTSSYVIPCLGNNYDCIL